MASATLIVESEPGGSEQRIGEPQPERQLLIPDQQLVKNFLSEGREETPPNKLTQCMLAVLKFCFVSLGLWDNRWWSCIPRIIVSLLCIYQAVYDMYVVLGCKGFDCGFLQNTTDKNVTHHKDDRKLSNAVYTIASLGAVLSYGFIVVCFILAKQRKDFTLVSPADTMARNLCNKDVLQLCLYFVLITALYVCSVVLFYVIIRNQKRGATFDFLATGVASQFFAQLTAITTCHVFAVSSFALGTFARDAKRRIHDRNEGTLDDIIEIHEALCTLVFNTVSTYKLWFVFHWLSYGAAVILSVIYLSIEFHSRHKYGTPTLNLVYLCLFFICHVYLFIVPCIFAARITSCCTGIYDDINITISSKWNEGHPFRDRSNSALFLSYAKDRQCGFKIGKIRFNTSLAWFSLFFGLTGLLFHFVQ
ncbi:uncharacterized protein LOC141873245 [Acropora palmata]|uniref:uncharacterized protein LOC141873245 n=1 Tax=Acropora palmata TaxID=6131 RepID=UPI003DA10F3F